MTTATAPDLLSELRERQAQAQARKRPYLAPVVARDSLLYWIAVIAREAREAANRKIIHVAAGADVDQSTAWRFENHVTVPRELDRLMQSYADDLEIDQVRLWEEALQRWKDDAAVEFRPADGTLPAAPGLPPVPNGSSPQPRQKRSRQAQTQPQAPKRKTA